LLLISKHLARLATTVPKKDRQKIRRPIRLAAAFIQATNLPFDLSEGRIMGVIEAAGPPIYGWISPDGPPDDIHWHLSTEYIRQRSN
jgi:hypothetical protein